MGQALSHPDQAGHMLASDRAIEFVPNDTGLLVRQAYRPAGRGAVVVSLCDCEPPIGPALDDDHSVVRRDVAELRATPNAACCQLVREELLHGLCPHPVAAAWGGSTVVKVLRRPDVPGGLRCQFGKPGGRSGFATRTRDLLKEGAGLMLARLVIGRDPRVDPAIQPAGQGGEDDAHHAACSDEGAGEGRAGRKSFGVTWPEVA